MAVSVPKEPSTKKAGNLGVRDDKRGSDVGTCGKSDGVLVLFLTPFWWGKIPLLNVLLMPFSAKLSKL